MSAILRSRTRGDCGGRETTDPRLRLKSTALPIWRSTLAGTSTDTNFRATSAESMRPLIRLRPWLRNVIVPNENPVLAGCFESIGSLRMIGSGSLLLAEFTHNRVSVFDPVSRRFTVIASNGDSKSTTDGGWREMRASPALTAWH